MSLSKPAYSAYRILVVDDQLEMLALLRRMLTQLGFSNISTAEDVPGAVSLMSRERFHLLLTDYNMGGNTGLELVRRARQENTGWRTRSDVPIVMITGHGEREYVLAAREAGVSAFLVKPVAKAQLEEKVMAVLARVPPPA